MWLGRLTKPYDLNKTISKMTEVNHWAKYLNNEVGYWRFLCSQSWVYVLTVRIGPGKLLFFAPLLASTPERLKQVCEFITSGQCNYLGSGHVTEIDTTQSGLAIDSYPWQSAPVSSHSKEWIIGLCKPPLFDLPLGGCCVIKEPLFYHRGGNEWTRQWRELRQSEAFVSPPGSNSFTVGT